MVVYSFLGTESFSASSTAGISPGFGAGALTAQQGLETSPASFHLNLKELVDLKNHIFFSAWKLKELPPPTLLEHCLQTVGEFLALFSKLYIIRERDPVPWSSCKGNLHMVFGTLLLPKMISRAYAIYPEGEVLVLLGTVNVIKTLREYEAYLTPNGFKVSQTSRTFFGKSHLRICGPITSVWKSCHATSIFGLLSTRLPRYDG